MEEIHEEGVQTSSSPAPEMSEIGTVANIFFEPGRTFEDLRRKPRFVIGMILIALCAVAYTFGVSYKVGEDGMRRFMAEQFEKNPQTQSMSGEAKQNAIDMQIKIQSYVRYGIPVVVLVFLLLGGLFYFLGTKAFGGSGGFTSSLAVWVYSSLPPTLISTIGSLIVLAIKSPDEIDLATSQRGLVHANPSMFIDGKEQPIIATLLATLDLFMIWGWILAAIGLRITNRLSSGSAWAVVIIVAVIGILFRLLSAILSGNPS